MIHGIQSTKRRSFIKNHHITTIFLALKITSEATEEGRVQQAPAGSLFAYDPELHYPVEAKSGADVVFIGTGAQERRPWLKSVGDIPGMERQNLWEQLG